MTPLPPPPPSGRKKRARKLTNSERGKLYRSRRKTYVSALAEDVEQLKRRVDELQQRRAAGQAALDQLRVERPQWTRMDLAGGALSISAVEQVVVEYFSQFECGLPPPRRGEALALADTPQARFVTGVMHRDLVFAHRPRGHGVATLLEQWSRYSTYHSVLDFELSRLEVVARDPLPVVHAPATLRVRFSRTTVEKLFPHVLWDAALVQKLVGLEVTYSVGNTFYFGEDRLIHRYDTWVDFVAALVGALGSVAQSMQLLESANIRDEAMLGDGEWADTRRREWRAEMDHTRRAMSLRAIL